MQIPVRKSPFDFSSFHPIEREPSLDYGQVRDSSQHSDEAVPTRPMHFGQLGAVTQDRGCWLGLSRR
jgi:hypothetical protein